MHLHKGERTCLFCMKEESSSSGPTLTMKKCSACRSVSYCSADCQKKDWKEHKLACQNLKELKERQKGCVAKEAEWLSSAQAQARTDVDFDQMNGQQVSEFLFPVTPRNELEWFRMFERQWGRSNENVDFDSHFFRLTLVAFVENGGDLGMKHVNGWTLMHSAASDDAVEAMKILKDVGLSTNIKTGKNSAGFTSESSPLHIAGMLGKSKAIEALAQLGANIEQTNISSETPILSCKANLKTLNALERAGADVKVKRWVMVQGRGEEWNLLDCLINMMWDWTFVHHAPHQYKIRKVIKWCHDRGVKESPCSLLRLEALLKRWCE